MITSSNKITVVVFDFDNCLALDEETREGSEEIKDRAWLDVFPEYESEKLKSILNKNALNLAEGRSDRKNIVLQILRCFNFPESQIPDEMIRRCDRFNEITQNNIKQIRISDNTMRTLARLSSRFALYINTATPIENVSESLVALKLFGYFKKVYGRPGTKTENLLEIISREKIEPAQMLFIDDQQSGWNIAQKVGCKFVGISTARNKIWHSNPQTFPIIKYLRDLIEIIDKSLSSGEVNLF